MIFFSRLVLFNGRNVQASSFRLSTLLLHASHLDDNITLFHMFLSFAYLVVGVVVVNGSGGRDGDGTSTIPASSLLIFVSLIVSFVIPCSCLGNNDVCPFYFYSIRNSSIGMSRVNCCLFVSSSLYVHDAFDLSNAQVDVMLPLSLSLLFSPFAWTQVYFYFIKECMK